MPHDDLFPIELLGLRAQESILAEFGGRRPSVREVASIPEAHLRQLPGFGPSTIRKLRSLTQSEIKSLSTVAGLGDAELLTEYHRLSTEQTRLRVEFKQREQELREQLRTVRSELRMRGLSPQ